MKIHAGHIEVAVAELVGWRTHVIVPNVSWGLGLNHECDLLVLDAKSKFTEIEIKVTLSDLKRDFSKFHGHRSDMITRLVYAVPDTLTDQALALVPRHCGIIEVKFVEAGGRFQAYWVRNCKHRNENGPGPETITKFLKLGCMRVWTLKQTLNQRTDAAREQKRLEVIREE